MMQSTAILLRLELLRKLYRCKFAIEENGLSAFPDGLRNHNELKKYSSFQLPLRGRCEDESFGFLKILEIQSSCMPIERLFFFYRNQTLRRSKVSSRVRLLPLGHSPRKGAPLTLVDNWPPLTTKIALPPTDHRTVLPIEWIAMEQVAVVVVIPIPNYHHRRRLCRYHHWPNSDPVRFNWRCSFSPIC